MKKYIIMLAMIVSGCAIHPPLNIGTTTDIVVDGQTIGKAPPPKMPDLPESLAKKAVKLKPLTDPTVIGQQTDAIDTDRRYNDVSHQLNDIIDAWSCVTIALNNGDNANTCFKGKKN